MRQVRTRPVFSDITVRGGQLAETQVFFGGRVS